jgi:hypothetical protein
VVGLSAYAAETSAVYYLSGNGNDDDAAIEEED